MDKGKFALYRTVDVDAEDIITRLGKGITGSTFTFANLHLQIPTDLKPSC